MQTGSTTVEPPKLLANPKTIPQAKPHTNGQTRSTYAPGPANPPCGKDPERRQQQTDPETGGADINTPTHFASPHMRDTANAGEIRNTNSRDMEIRELNLKGGVQNRSCSAKQERGFQTIGRDALWRAWMPL